MAAEEQENERTAVKTYVPAYQRDAWDDHAAELDMSRSEFVRTMVQAGRKGFDPGGHASESEESRDTAEESEESPMSGNLEQLVRETLRNGPRSWEELFQAATDDVESDLEAALEKLQARNEIKYSGPKGGYVLVE